MSRMTLEKLAQITAHGFRETATKAELLAMGERISGVDGKLDKLDQKIDYRYNALANRIDDLAMTRTTRIEHATLTKRVSKIEKKLSLA